MQVQKSQIESLKSITGIARFIKSLMLNLWSISQTLVSIIAFLTVTI